LYLTDFTDSVVLRLARLDLVRNQWRQFTFNVDTTGSYTPINNSSGTILNTLAVNLEENSKPHTGELHHATGYRTCAVTKQQRREPAAERTGDEFESKQPRYRRCTRCFKTMNLDMRQYGRLSMFLHAESVVGQRALATMK
jgi:cell surface protein SprA